MESAMTDEQMIDLRDLLGYLEGRSSPPFPNSQAADCVRAALAFIREKRSIKREAMRRYRARKAKP